MDDLFDLPSTNTATYTRKHREIVSASAAGDRGAKKKLWSPPPQQQQHCSYIGGSDVDYYAPEGSEERLGVGAPLSRTRVALMDPAAPTACLAPPPRTLWQRFWALLSPKVQSGRPLTGRRAPLLHAAHSDATRRCDDSDDDQDDPLHPSWSGGGAVPLVRPLSAPATAPAALAPPPPPPLAFVTHGPLGRTPAHFNTATDDFFLKEPPRRRPEVPREECEDDGCDNWSSSSSSAAQFQSGDWESSSESLCCDFPEETDSEEWIRFLDDLSMTRNISMEDCDDIDSHF